MVSSWLSSAASVAVSVLESVVVVVVVSVVVVSSAAVVADGSSGWFPSGCPIGKPMPIPVPPPVFKPSLVACKMRIVPPAKFISALDSMPSVAWSIVIEPSVIAKSPWLLMPIAMEELNSSVPPEQVNAPPLCIQWSVVFA